MSMFVWPVQQMAMILGGRLIRRHGDEYTIRCDNPDLGVKMKIDIDCTSDDLRVVIDRLSKHRPTFIASLVIDPVVGVDLNEQDCTVDIKLAGGQTVSISADCTVQLYRPL